MSPELADSFFARYVLAGGWSMVLLIPASIVSVGVFLRCFVMLRPAAAAVMAGELRARVAEWNGAEGTEPNFDSCLALAYAKSLSLYASFQPLVAIYMLAPALGFLGSLYALYEAHRRFARTSDLARLGDALSSALVPAMWGTWIALCAALFFVILRGRLYRVETQWFLPAVTDPADERKPRLRKPGRLRES